MPRYFFHVHDGHDFPDEEGTDLEDLAAARRHAVRYAAEALLGSYDIFWNGNDWFMDVTDEQGLMLFRLHFLATDAPSTLKH